MTWSAIALGISQIPFFLAFAWGALMPRRQDMDNPWQAASLEWSTSSPPPHFNWEGLPPTVERGPYDYSTVGEERDFRPQWSSSPPPGAVPPA